MRLRGVQARGIALAALIGVFASPAAAQRYVVEDLGSLGGDLSQALSIDRRGVVVGHSRLPGSSALHAFVYDGTMTDLGTLGGAQSIARAINKFDEIVGWSFPATGERHAFLYKGSTMLDLGTFGGFSDAHDINDSREIVGSSLLLPEFSERAFLWRNGVMHELGTFGGTESRAYAINEHGDVAGFAQNGGGDLRPFLYRSGQLIDLGSLGGWSGHAFDLNENGKVVGWSMKIPNHISHAFLWSEGVIIDLGSLGGVYSAAFGINESGVVVGASTRVDGSQAAFIWDGIKMVDLNTLIPPSSGWDLLSANAINDDGRIVGYGMRGGLVRAFRLTPEGILGIGPADPVQVFALHPPSPNPMRAGTQVRFSLPASSHAEIAVFDVTGRRVRLLAARTFAAGMSSVRWDGRNDAGADVEGGVYWIRLTAGGEVRTARLAILR